MEFQVRRGRTFCLAIFLVSLLVCYAIEPNNEPPAANKRGRDKRCAMAENPDDSSSDRHLVDGTLGIDVSTPVSVATFQCLKTENIQHVIVRAYRSNGQVDSNARSTVSNAIAAKISEVDIYMYPSLGKSASLQVNETVEYMTGITYGKIWLDIEGGWNNLKVTNQQFFEELLNASNMYMPAGTSVAVYTSKNSWNTIMGHGYTGGSSYQLWYPHYDNDPSFSDFQAFGGWTVPFMKQYEANVNLCGANVDRNWRP